METTNRQTAEDIRTGATRHRTGNGVTHLPPRKPATRFILQTSPKVLAGLRVIPVAMPLVGR